MSRVAGMSKRKFGFFCVCGGAMTGSVAPAKRADDLERAFRSVHTGPGHQPSGRRAAAGARADAEGER